MAINKRTVGIAVSVLALSVFASSASAQARRYTGNGVTVYTNPNFSGQSVTFRSDTPDLRGYSLNDKISSLDIPSGESWEFCQDINYQNRCQVFSGSVSNLSQMGWNDKISSLRRVATNYNSRGRSGNVIVPNNARQGLVLFDRPFFRGNATTLSNNANVGLTLGSAQVRGGTWQICDRTNHCATVSQDVPDLSKLGLTGRITSARLVNGYQNNGSNGVYDRRYNGR